MPNGKPPTNLPTPPTGPKEASPAEPERAVPERPIFPQKASEKLPQEPEVDRFGAPGDIVPKQEPKQETEGKKEPTAFMPEEGLTPEKIARRETIKKALLFIIIVLLVIFAGVFVVSRWLIPKKTEKTTATPAVSPPKITTPEIKEGADTDSDGLPDTFEQEHKLNLNDPADAKLDPDVDKLTNLEEYKYQTDPQNSDTDRDGYKDGDEVKNGYNPKGSGKLEEKTTEGEKNFPTMKGTWQGTMTGAFYQIKDLNLTAQADGRLSGKFSSHYQQYKIQNEISGSYDFKKETNTFSATLSGSAVILGKIKDISGEGLFTLNLDGKETSGEISGTWVLSPKTSGLVWLKNDRGNFKIKKIKTI